MADHYETYSGCIETPALESQQGQLANILIDSLPETVRKDVRNTLRSVAQHNRTWDETFNIATRALQELQAEARRKHRFGCRAAVARSIAGAHCS